MRRSIDAFFFDPAELLSRASALRAKYAAAEPFPHAVIDDLVPLDVLRTVAGEFPPPGTPGGGTSDTATQRKSHYRQHAVLGPSTRQLISELNDGPFIDFLEELTGIRGLIADPHLSGGGLHQIEPGGFLKVHADFGRLNRLQLNRRVNLIVYLNDDWDDRYGGALELWSQDMRRCVERVAPRMGTCIVFNTEADAYHGHPDPLRCPPGRTRDSLALYYYTSAGFGERPPVSSHRWLARPHESLGWKHRLRPFTPPVLLDALRAWRRRRAGRG